ncbi:hypothetical protein EST38_g1115 [Candolleomyces aberdarensis]|uniref:RNA helicase n=1 Tax=Candolleomyces aberdarensis TaxID=2316362 RepID=A0A4Q2DWY9_9AGAR|nr:hypothetical protein EST38_g1115 [Candolleomyces aberdarensis]
MSKDDSLVASLDATTVEKQSKKSKDKSRSKKKKSKQEKLEQAEGAEVNGNDAGLSESQSDDKKEKKKERRKEEVELETNQEAAAVDAEDSKKKRKKQKKQKREKKEKASKPATDSQDDAVQVDGAEASNESYPVESQDTPKESKNEKKRKREAEETENGEAEVVSRKEKKKRRKEEGSSSPQDTSLPAAGSSSSAPSPSKSQPTPASVSISPKETEEFLKKHSITIHTPESDDTPITPIISFNQLASLPEGLTDAFKTFKEPSPIQACTWPPALAGKDVVGIAETGSGKTLAFGIPALNALINSTTKTSSSNVSTLIVAPTRELAIQTHDTLSALGKPFGIASVAIFGGVPKEGQISMLRASMKKGKDGLLTRIVVGTPGRILDLMQDGALDLSGCVGWVIIIPFLPTNSMLSVNYLVLDEADRMLDKGFENDIRRIIEATKPMKERQTMMFSATWPEAVRRLASTFQRNPVRVTVGSDDLTANSRVEQKVEVFEDARSKDQRLMGHLRKLLPNKKPTKGIAESRVLVFALYKKEASRVEQTLQRQGYAVGALHGDMSQNARMDALEKFKTGVTNLLIATDVAARGLDIPNVAAVINYTFPLTIEDYIHRIGRTGESLPGAKLVIPVDARVTGRGGKSGKSITFFTGDNHEKSLAGEYARVLREGGFDYEPLKIFPMTIKKKEHSVYGAFYRDDIAAPKAPTKITF